MLYINLKKKKKKKLKEKFYMTLDLAFSLYTKHQMHDSF